MNQDSQIIRTSEVLVDAEEGTQFHLHQRISQNHLADVFRASFGDKAVALKRYRQHLPEEARARAGRENQAQAAVSHPCVAALIARGESREGLPYMASEWIEGETLEQRLQQGRLDAREALSIVHALCRGLGAIHAQNIVHRDIKPSNIMLPASNESTEAVILDFGHSLLVDEERITEQSQVLGSAAYMAPEQVQGESLDGRADLYSLGVVLFRCLTGQRPFDHPSEAELMMMHLHEPVPSPQVAAPDADIPDSLQDLCLWLLSKNKETRVPNTRVLRLTIEAIASSEIAAEESFTPPTVQREGAQ